MKAIKKLTAASIGAALAVSCVGANVYAQERTMDIKIDGSKANTAENYLYRGAGMVTGNNSSRLLLDYKAKSPEAYNEIMEYLFGEKGLALSHIKIEMGSDINSSSGTEPAVKRTEDEAADVTRGAGYQLAADAKKINPDITLDMLWWSEPLWVTNAEDVYAARYKWYKETLDAAYSTYGLKFDYVSATQNERAADNEWIKYLSKSLKAETDCPYDYSKIKIVIGDEVCTWNAANSALADEKLMNAIDVIGSHYTSWSSDKAQRAAAEYGKELWFSEASTPMVYSKGTYRFDSDGSGLNDLNGILDIANRYITMYPSGKMTMCEYQPVISAYYDGVTYCHKQFIEANSPWNGVYNLDNGFYMQLHFSQFIKKGWAFVDDACYGDGVAGGDGHAIVDAVYSYVTAADTNTGDYSTVITNTTDDIITYNISAVNLDKADAPVYVWETRGPDNGQEYNANYFKNVDVITPKENADGTYSYSVAVKPSSIVTLSTLDIGFDESAYKKFDESEKTVLTLPYSDDFGYSEFADDFLDSRGGAPLYMTDEGGAFEVQTDSSGNNYLMQIITPETKANEWGGTPEPTTNFGDDRWNNYSVSADVRVVGGYAGVGLRYNLAANGASGYWFRIYDSGKWSLMKNSKELMSGMLEGVDSAAWNTIKIEAVFDEITAFVNGTQVAQYKETGSLTAAGRAALYSSYDQNCFDNILVEPIENTDTYITRFDNTDANFTAYEGDWIFETISSFKSYKRTVFRGTQGASVTFEFDGTGFAITGNTKKDCVLSVTVDGEEIETAYAAPVSSFRESPYHKYGLENGRHTVTISVKEGKLSIDALEVVGDKIPLPVIREESQDEAENEESKPTDQGKPIEEAAPNESSADTDEKPSQGFPVIPVAIAAGTAAIGIAAAVIISKKKKK